MKGNHIKAIYLFMYMGFATWRVFFNVYLERLHFSGTEIGILNAIILATLAFIVPVWGFYADKNGIRPTLRITALITALLIFVLGYMHTFGLMVAVVLVLSLFYNPLGSLSDTLAIQFSHKHTRYNYGKFRLWGSLGWGIAATGGGYLFSRIDLKYIFPVSAFFFLALLIFLRKSKKEKVVYKPKFQPVDLRSLLHNRQLMLFSGILVIYGIACSPAYTYINLYFTELKASNRIIGIAFTIQSVSELPFFFIGGSLVKKIGNKRVILISMAGMVIRLMMYGLFPSIATGLAFGALQGMTLSFFLVGIVDYMHKLLPPGRHATAQSLIWAFYQGLGQTFGNLSVGLLKDSVGMVGIMWRYGILVIIIFFLTAFYFYGRRKGQVAA